MSYSTKRTTTPYPEPDNSQSTSSDLLSPTLSQYFSFPQLHHANLSPEFSRLKFNKIFSSSLCVLPDTSTTFFLNFHPNNRLKKENLDLLFMRLSPSITHFSPYILFSKSISLVCIVYFHLQSG